MSVALISNLVRTPIAPVHGALSGWHPVDLFAHTMEACRASAGIDASDVDLVLAGCAMQVGAQSHNLARAAALSIGWSPSTVGTMIEAGAGSGHQALLHALAMVESGQASCVIAGAVEVMSLVPDGASSLARNYGRLWGDPFRERYDDAMLPQNARANAWARATGLTSQHADEALRARQSLPAASPVLQTAALRRDGSSIIDERRSILHDFEPTLSTEDLEPIGGDANWLTADMVAAMGDGAAAAMVVSADFATRQGLAGLLRASGSTYHGDEPFNDAVTVIKAAEDAGSSSWISVDEPTVVTAIEADRRFGPPPRKGPLLTGRPTAVGTLAAIVDFALSDHETGVVASNLGLGAAVATTFERLG